MDDLQLVAAEALVIPLSGEDARPEGRSVAVEAAVEVSFGGVPFAVMMLTPADLADFARGFSLTEGIVSAAAEVRSIAVEPRPAGWHVGIEVAPDRMHTLLARRRSMAGRTGCGVCGIEDAAALLRAPSPSTPPAGAAPIRVAAVARALAGLPDRQVLNRATGAAHAAAFADRDGAIVFVREDVGRHNALDKLVGAIMAAGRDPAEGFVVVTSRCSFEMVEKTATLGARTIVAISAPTSFAIERARALDVTLVAIARRDSVTVFTGRERIAP